MPISAFSFKKNTSAPIEKEGSAASKKRSTKTKAAAVPAAEKMARETGAEKFSDGTYLVIDYPRENDVLTAPEYVIRIGAAGEKHVELSIDKGPWQSCRHAAGFWWFDWKLQVSGKHTLKARFLMVNGQYREGIVRNCSYKPAR